jgi:hypothetical protein
MASACRALTRRNRARGPPADQAHQVASVPPAASHQAANACQSRGGRSMGRPTEAARWETTRETLEGGMVPLRPELAVVSTSPRTRSVSC